MIPFSKSCTATARSYSASVAMTRRHSLSTSRRKCATLVELCSARPRQGLELHAADLRSLEGRAHPAAWTSLRQIEKILFLKMPAVVFGRPGGAPQDAAKGPHDRHPLGRDLVDFGGGGVAGSLRPIGRRSSPSASNRCKPSG